MIRFIYCSLYIYMYFVFIKIVEIFYEENLIEINLIFKILFFDICIFYEYFLEMGILYSFKVFLNFYMS